MSPQLSFFGPAKSHDGVALRSSYHVRASVQGPAAEVAAEVKSGEEKAKDQDTKILWLFRDGRTRLTPSEARDRYQAEFGKPILLTSARRALTNLTREGLLRMMDERRLNPATGGMEHLWEIRA